MTEPSAKPTYQHIGVIGAGAWGTALALVAAAAGTKVTLGAREPVAARLAATLGRAANFRPYVSEDIAGVALGGAAKNVYAIGCGMVEGAGLGESAGAALLARSFAELLRLGAAMNARAETL